MNILHMKYAVEIAKLGSINKAAEALLIAQPNLSRAVKELEADLGVSIFDRSSKGMFLTPEGEKFIGYAKKILQQIDEVENMYKTGAPARQKFSICVPRASYISDAFANFSTQVKQQAAEIFYQETNSSHVINNVLNAEYKLGILRYAENYDKYFKASLEEKGLAYELITEFTYQLIMNRNSPLASYGEIRCEHLRDFIEIAHADPFVPSLPLAEVKKEELPDDIERRIFVFERASQFDLLAENEQTFMWVSPVPDKTLQRYGLIQRKCVDNTRVYKDMLVYRKDYRLTELDNCFITELCNSKRKHFS